MRLLGSMVMVACLLAASPAAADLVCDGHAGNTGTIGGGTPPPDVGFVSASITLSNSGDLKSREVDWMPKDTPGFQRPWIELQFSLSDDQLASARLSAIKVNGILPADLPKRLFVIMQLNREGAPAIIEWADWKKQTSPGPATIGKEITGSMMFATVPRTPANEQIYDRIGGPDAKQLLVRLVGENGVSVLSGEFDISPPIASNPLAIIAWNQSKDTYANNRRRCRRL